MPPAPKFSREQIIDAALSIVREKGMEMLTARELADRLGSSTRPIFTVFKDMDELKAAVYLAAERFLQEYIERSLRFTPAFKQQGLLIIHFAMDEPRLFQMLEMTPNGEPKDIDTLFRERGASDKVMMDIIEKQYGLTEDEAHMLFKHVWIYTYGICVLCATHQCEFKEEELVQMLGTDFLAMLGYIKSGGLKRVTETPVPLEGEGKKD